MIYNLMADIVSTFTAKAFERNGLTVIVDPFAEDAINVVPMYADIWTVNDQDGYETRKASISIPGSVAPSQRESYIQGLVNQALPGWFVEDIYEAESDV